MFLLKKNPEFLPIIKIRISLHIHKFQVDKINE